MPTNNLPALNMIIRAQDKTATAFKSVERNTDKITRRLERLEKRASGAGRVLRTVLGAVATAAGARQVGSLADEYVNLQNKLSVVTNSTQELADVTTRLFQISQDTRTAFSATATVYGRLALQAGELGLSQQEMLRITERLNQAVIVGGSTAAEASNAMIQLSQGLASGALRGDELRSVLEQLPIVSKLIAKEMGVTVGQLRDLGAEGAITGRIVADALLKADDVAASFAGTSSTLSQAFTRLNNQAVLFTGSLGQSSGVINGLVSAINFATNNFGQLANAVGAAGLGLATYFGASVIASVVGALRGLVVTVGAVTTAMTVLRGATAFLFGPIGIALTAAGAAMAFFATQTAKAAKHAQEIDQATNNLVAKYSGQIASGNVSLDGLVSRLAGTRDEIKRELAAIEELIVEKQADLEAAKDKTVFGLGVVGFANKDVTKISGQIEELTGRASKMRSSLQSVTSVHATFNQQLNAQTNAATRAADATKGLGESTKATSTAFDDFLAKLKSEQSLVGASSSEKERATLLERGLIALKKQHKTVTDEHVATMTAEIDKLLGLKTANEQATGAMKARADAAQKLKDLIEETVQKNENRDDSIRGIQQRLTYQKLINQGKAAEANAQQHINQLLSDGHGLSEEHITQIKELYVQLEEASTKVKDAAARAADPGPWEQYKKSLTDIQGQIEDGTVRAFQKMEDAFVTMVRTGKLQFKDLANSILEDLARIAIRKAIVSPLANLIGFASGGPVNVPKFATGGVVSGPGSGTSDSILARLSNQEYVVNAQASKKYRPMLDAINSGKGINSAVTNVIINNNAPVELATSETTSSNGTRNLEIFIDQAVTKSLMSGSGRQALRAASGA